MRYLERSGWQKEHKIILNGQKDRESESRLQTLNEKKKKKKREDSLFRFGSKKRCNVETTERFDEWKAIAMEEQISKNVIW